MQLSNRSKGWIQFALIVTFLLGAYAFTRYLSQQNGSPAAPPAGEKTYRVTTQTVARDSHPVRFAVNGTVVLNSPVVLVPEVTGKVEYVADTLRPGGEFDADELLWRVEQVDYRQAVKQARAQLAEARAAMAQLEAEAAVSVQQWRRENPGRSAPPLVAMQPQLDRAQARIEAAEARLDSAQTDLQRTEFRLPFAGRVTRVELEPGQAVRAGASVGRAYAYAALEVAVPLTAQQLQWLQQAQAVTVQTETETFAAELVRSAAEADRQTRYRNAYLQPVAVDVRRRLVPGAFAAVQVTGPRRDDLWRIPAAALQDGDTLWVVDDKQRLRALQPEVVQHGKRFFLARATRERIEVVTSPLDKPVAGSAVQRRDDTAGADTES